MVKPLDAGDLFGPGLGETQRNLLLALKQHGPSTVTALSAELGLAATTLRGHLQTLAGQGLIARRGQKYGKRGRPDVVFALGPEGERLFPRHESRVLSELIHHLRHQERAQVLDEFFAARAAARRERLLPRIEGLTGVDRLREVARILSEEGFMARVDIADGHATLHLCHCPIQGVVAETRAPCRYEEALISELLGGSALTRTDYMPDGGVACSYVEQPAPAPAPAPAATPAPLTLER